MFDGVGIYFGGKEFVVVLVICFGVIYCGVGILYYGFYVIVVIWINIDIYV